MSKYKKKSPALHIPTDQTVAMKEKFRIGKEIKHALDEIIPANRRMTDAQIAKQLGISQQAVTRTVNLACYKLRMKMLEVLREDRELLGATERGIAMPTPVIDPSTGYTVD